MTSALDRKPQMWKSMPVLAAISIALWGCTTLEGRPTSELESRYGDNAPTIETAFAAETIPPRSIWRIYIKGSDPDGDIQSVKVWADVPWSSLPSTVKLEPDQSQFVSGYLELDTIWFLDYAPMWIRAQVMLQDRANHKSELVEFQTSMSAGVEPAQPAPKVFQEIYLGRIPVDRISRPTLGR